MNKQQYTRQLKDHDPEKRKSAVKAAARATDKDVLRQLAVMVEDDPDPEVRELALRAGGFIRKQLGMTPEPEQEVDPKKKGRPDRIPVSDDNAARALAILNTAVTFNISGQNAKAMKELRKALDLDPNLRHDGYFINLAEVATGRQGEGAAAIALLADKKEQENIASVEKRQRTQHQVDEHLAEVGKVTLPNALLDMGMLFAVVTVAAMVVMFLYVQSAGNLLSRLDQNIIDIQDAQAAGRVRQNPDGTVTYLSDQVDSTNNPIPIKELIIPDEFFASATQLRSTEMALIVVAALATGALTTLTAALMAVLAHVVAAILQGKGKLPFMLHRTAGILTNRTLIIGGLLMAGSFLIFDGGSSGAITAVLALVALVGALTAFALVTTCGKAYNFGAAKGLIAMLPGLVLAGAVIGGAVILL